MSIATVVVGIVRITHLYSYLCIEQFENWLGFADCFKTLEKTELAIKNAQSRGTSNIGNKTQSEDK
jgi:hypothetical protein